MKAANPVWPHAGVGTRICATWGWYGSGNGSQPSSCSTPHLSLQVQQLMASSSVWTLGKKSLFRKSGRMLEWERRGSRKSSLQRAESLHPLLVKHPYRVMVYFHSLQPRNRALCPPPKARTRAAAPHPQQIFIALLTAQSWRSSGVCSCSAVGRLPLLF